MADQEPPPPRRSKRMRSPSPPPRYPFDRQATFSHTDRPENDQVLHPVVDQGDTLTCGPHSITNVGSAAYKLMHGGPLLRLSPQELIDFGVEGEENVEDFTGITLQQGFRHFKIKGIGMEEDYGYVGHKQLGTQPPQGNRLKIGDFKSVDVHSFACVCAAIDVRPLVASINFTPAFQLHRGMGIYKDRKVPKQALSKEFLADADEETLHFIILMGYGSEEVRKGKVEEYYLFQNSQGELSGQGGYGKICPDEILQAIQPLPPFEIISSEVLSSVAG